MRLVLGFVFVFLSPVATCFVATKNSARKNNEATRIHLFGNPAGVKIPASPSDRDKQAIDAVKAAIAKPRTASFPLIECEFPPLQALNKLGDGSLRSAVEVDTANISFSAKLAKSIAPLPILGPKTWLLTSSAASNAFNAKAEASVKGSATSVFSLRNGSPETGNGDVCILISPSGRDYKVAEQLAASKVKVVMVNGFAKDTSSVSGSATMAYYLKPLTYNSQIAGYCVRSYPNKWAVIDVSSRSVLGMFADSEILYANTNTPDLRAPGGLVQASVNERAIKARKGR